MNFSRAENNYVVKILSLVYDIFNVRCLESYGRYVYVSTPQTSFVSSLSYLHLLKA